MILRTEFLGTSALEPLLNESPCCASINYIKKNFAESMLFPIHINLLRVKFPNLKILAIIGDLKVQDATLKALEEKNIRLLEIS